MHYCRSYGVGNVEGKEIEYLHSTILKIDIRFSEQLRYKMVVSRLPRTGRYLF